MASKSIEGLCVLVCALAGAGVAGQASGDDRDSGAQDGADLRTSVISERVFLGEMRLRLIQNEKPSGEWYVNARREDDRLIHVGTTSLAPDVQESEILVANWSTWRPDRVVIEGDFGRRILEADLAWDGDRFSGSYHLREPMELDKREIPVDQEGPEGTMLRGSVLLLVSALPLADGRKFHATWFSSLGGQHEDVTVTVSDGGPIDTPLGRFDTYRAKVAGGTPENVVYVAKGEQPHIVRVDVLGNDMRFELLEIEHRSASATE